MKKTITLYNYEINGIVENLVKPQSIMYSNDPEKKLPISVLWRMDENMEKLQGIVNRIRAKREEIEQEYVDDEHSATVTLESGEVVRQIKDEYHKEFNKRLQELMTIKNEVEISCINVDELEGYSLIPSDYRSIRFMLDKEDEKEEPDDEKKETVD